MQSQSLSRTELGIAWVPVVPQHSAYELGWQLRWGFLVLLEALPQLFHVQRLESLPDLVVAEERQDGTTAVVQEVRPLLQKIS